MALASSSIASRVARGEKVAVAEALNLVEDRREIAQAAAEELLHSLRAAPRSVAGHRIGITGPPGVGKSTLTAELARLYRREGKSVGVLAVDPTSVRSGGALLGDRARMAFDPSDDGVYVRSVATGGEAGGLSRSAAAIVRVFAAAFDVVLIETTGVGQTETDVVDVADTVILVVQPGSGDTLQFIKAGVMEIPDLCVVNKSDESALATRAVADLTAALHAVRSAGAGESVPVLQTSALHGNGIDELARALDERRAQTRDDARLARRARADVHWATSIFRRMHGEHGVSLLGGIDALANDARARLAQLAPPAIARGWSARYLDALRQTPA